MKNTQKSLFRVLAVVIAALLIIGFTSICFAADDDASGEVGITKVSLLLDEDITVKLRTTAAKNDGSKIVVAWGGEEIELTQHIGGSFLLAGITPSNMSDTLTATMYSAEGEQIGEAVSFSVRSYLEALLGLRYEESGCSSELQYTAMKELAVNMLNYGAAAQEYTNYNVDNLANKNLTDEQKALATKPITVSNGDKAVSGDAWVGAGVRFDYRLGLYFVFEAESLEGITATINGKEVTPVVYNESENWYIIRYSDFNVTGMNDVITAKLTIGEEEQTYAYSIKSYVAAKGSNGSALAKLVNATYAYGYAAVAFSGELTTIDPTFESKGSASIDSKGYDFTGTAYGTVELPVFSDEDYTIITTVSAQSANPIVTTTFTLKNGAVNYSVKVESKNALKVNDRYYSSHDIGLLNSDDVEVTYDTATGYTYNAKTEQALTYIAAYGAPLTVTGKVVINRDTNDWIHYNAFNVGTESVDGNVTVNNVGATRGMRFENGADMYIAEGSSLTILGSNTYSIIAYAQGTSIVVDGTLTTASKIRLEKAAVLNTSAEYGFNPTLYVRKGTVTIQNGQLLTNSLQVGSVKDGYKGTLNITQTVKGSNYATSAGKTENTISFENSSAALRYVFANGEVNLTNNSDTGLTGIDIRNAYTTYVLFDSGITVNAGGKSIYDNLIGCWSYGSDYRLGIHADAKFDCNYTRIMHHGVSKSLKVVYYDTATINIDGEYKDVRIATGYRYNSSSTTYIELSDLTVDNGDGTKSLPDITPVEGVAYTTASGNISCYTWDGFVKANCTDEDGIAHSIYYQVLSAHSHKGTLVERQDATCTATGTEAYYKCACGKLFSDEEAKNEISAPAVIPVKAHTEVTDDAVAATCTETGLTEGKHCSACGTVTVEQEPTSAIGHLDEDSNYVCDRTGCGASLCESHVVVTDEKKDATCTENGLTEGSHCSVCGEIFVAQTVIEALGHTEVVVDGKAATCTEDGLTESRYCSVCDEIFAEQTVIEAINHKNAKYSSQIDATFETEGQRAYYACPDCGKNFTDETCTTEVTTSLVTPKLNLTDYTTATTSGESTTPTVTTTFTLNNSELAYSVSVTGSNCIRVNGRYYSIYEIALLNSDDVEVIYDEATGYIYNAKTEQTLTYIAAYGAPLTVTGKVVINRDTNDWIHYNAFNVGTESVDGNVTVNNVGATRGMTFQNGADMYIAEGSSLTISGSNTYSIIAYAQGTSIVVDGTLTAANKIRLEKAAVLNTSAEYGFNPTLYVRKGTVTIQNGQLLTNSLQVGSVKDGYYGTLNIDQSYQGTNWATGNFRAENTINVENASGQIRYAFANGKLNINDTWTGGTLTAIDIRTSASSYVLFDSGITVNTTGYNNLVGYWSYGSDYRVGVHADAKINHGGSILCRSGDAKALKITYFDTATINIDGVDKTVLIATGYKHNESSNTSISTTDFTVDNGDGTKSLTDILPIEGAAYVTGSGSVYCCSWSLTQATYTDDEGTVHTIYYMVSE